MGMSIVYVLRGHFDWAAPRLRARAEVSDLS